MYIYKQYARRHSEAFPVSLAIRQAVPMAQHQAKAPNKCLLANSRGVTQVDPQRPCGVQGPRRPALPMMHQ